MGHKQESATRQVLAQCRVIQGRHDGLPGPRGRRQQVPVVPLLAREDQLLEQSLLKRFRSQLRRRDERLRRAGRLFFRSLQEFLSVVRSEIRVVPIALKDGGHLVDHARIPSARNPDVPFEPDHLRRVREIRRTDVGRRESGTAIEQPCLRMQPRAAGVIRHPHLSAKITQLLKRALLRRSSVGRCQNPEFPSGLTMRPKRGNERRNTGPTNERHDHVNAIRGMDFGQHLAANARFARRVREQRGIEQRNQRVLNTIPDGRPGGDQRCCAGFRRGGWAVPDPRHFRTTMLG